MTASKRYCSECLASCPDAQGGLGDLGNCEERDFTVASTLHPSMIHDYSGFPEQTYHVAYPAPGSAGRKAHLGKIHCCP